MKLQFNGAARTVTGSLHLLDMDGVRILLDCGFFQGSKELDEKNNSFPFNPKNIDYVLISHGHIDHCGRLPLLVKNGFKGKIYATHATVDLCSILLKDSAKIEEAETRRENAYRKRKGLPKLKPLFEERDAAKCSKLFRGVDYDRVLNIDGIEVVFGDAGHILGSSIIEVWADGIKAVYSGDIGRLGMPILRDPTFIETADYLILESTYGSTEHQPFQPMINKIKGMVLKVYRRGSKLLIPAFSIGRTQTIIYILNQLVENNQIPIIPVYIDSPLAIDATEIFSRHPECYDAEFNELLRSGDDPLIFRGLKYVRNEEESFEISNNRETSIIIAASGMCTGGRIKNHLEWHINDPNSILLFVGYQAKGTLGRKLVQGNKNVKIYGKKYPVRIKVEALYGLSAHADKAYFLKWVKKIKGLKGLFLVHGNYQESQTLANDIHSKTQIKKIKIPKQGETVEIS
ncbi:MAG: MBL fold metallo-hydrolase RNA specificity domain-containing protein [Candidatus Lokiarchaeia archaeon]